MNESSVCADSSLLIKLTFLEDDTSKAEALWKEWRNSGTEVFAPSLLQYEFVSVARQAVRRGRVKKDDAYAALQALLALPLTVVQSSDLHLIAHKIANDLNIGSMYDAHYLALALALDCAFWTADARLYANVSDRFPLIRLLGA